MKTFNSIISIIDFYYNAFHSYEIPNWKKWNNIKRLLIINYNIASIMVNDFYNYHSIVIFTYA